MTRHQNNTNRMPTASRKRPALPPALLRNGGGRTRTIRSTKLRVARFRVAAGREGRTRVFRTARLVFLGTEIEREGRPHPVRSIRRSRAIWSLGGGGQITGSQKSPSAASCRARVGCFRLW